jgi:acyl transferase domain-containing protein
MTRCDEAIRRTAGWSIIEQLQASEAMWKLAETEFAQPGLFAMQVSLAALWREWGIRPGAVIGHSLGEIAALHVAGVYTLEQAARIAVERGRHMQPATGLGRMLALPLSASEVLPLIDNWRGRVSLAAINGPASVVVAGDAEALTALADQQRSRAVDARMLPVDYAFHSQQMDPFLAPLAASG